MATQFSEIYDLALVVIRDYKLENLYRVDEEAFYVYLQGFLINAIPEFTGCHQSLEYSIDSSSFVSDLTYQEKSILAKFMVIKWLEKEINDITQINLHLQGRDFKMNSEASNLKEKSEYLDRLREKVNQSITDYQFAYFKY
ncbi:MAG: hypothetical protein KBT06_00645 [Prevotellaceae bacterium]|nr:hypothetical protein [Candidatus Colivivens equi]